MSTIRWEGLDPATIEDGIKALLLELHAGARPVDGRGGDDGRDVRWDSPDGWVIFEIKSFAGERLTRTQQRQIEGSLARAALHRPVRWVLVLPMDHSPAEERWFDARMAQYPAIALEWRGRAWLNLEFGKREYLRRLVESESSELLQRAHEYRMEMEAVAGITDGITRVTRLNERMQALSPFWRPDVFTTPTGVGVVFKERFSGAAAMDPVQLRPTFDFPDGDPEAAAAKQQLQDMLDYGGDVEVDGKYVPNFEVVASPASQALFQPVGETARLRLTSVTHQVDPPTYQMVIVAPDGAVRHRYPLQMDTPTIGERGVRVRGRDAAGVFAVVITADRPELGAAVSCQISGSGAGGKLPYAVRPGFEIFTRIEPGDRLEVRADDRSLGQAEGMEEFLAEARLCANLIIALESLQARTGMLFPIPDDLTKHEANDIIFAARLLAGESVPTGRTWIGLTIKADMVESFLETEQIHTTGGLMVEMDNYTLPCGPHQLDLGPITMTALRLHLVNADELRAAVGTGTEPVARYECLDPTGVYIRIGHQDAGAHPSSSTSSI
jgi:hypothetical protein